MLPVLPAPAAAPRVTSKPRINPLWIDAPIERMRIGKSLIKKRPVEVTAVKHLRVPDDPEFLPAPARPDRYKIHCYVCSEYKWPEEFHKAVYNTWRLGRFTICKTCRKEGRTAANRWSHPVQA